MDGEAAAAKDALEGIAQWRVRQERTESVLRDVEQAVSRLVCKGLHFETRRRGVPPYYRLNPERREDGPLLLKGS